MGLLSNKIDRKELKPGDHIYCWRQAFIYAHHGIYVGDGKVIHFTQRPESQEKGKVIISSSLPALQISDVPCPQCGVQNSSFNNGVILSCIDCFLFGGELNLFEYGVSWVYFLAKVRGGTCTRATSDPPGNILHRAYFLLEKGFGEYDVLKNNCEDFAIYCKTGSLVRGGQSGQVAALEATDGLISSLLTNKFSVHAVVCSGVDYCKSRLTSDIGVRRDVMKVTVETVEKVVGHPPPPPPPPPPPHIHQQNGISKRKHNAVMSLDMTQAQAQYSNFRGNNMRGRSRGRGRGRNRGDSRFVCQLCGKTGHVVSSCYKRFDQAFQGLSLQNMRSQSQEGTNNNNNNSGFNGGPGNYQAGANPGKICSPG